MTLALFVVFLALVALGIVGKWWTPDVIPPAAWVTQADVEAMIADRTAPRWVDISHAIAGSIQTHEEFAHAPSVIVSRNELEPLIAAYCRKSLDDGGELRARVLEIVHAASPPFIVKPPPMPDSEPEPMTTQMKRNAVAAQVRLHAAAEKSAPKRKGRR